MAKSMHWIWDNIVQTKLTRFLTFWANSLDLLHNFPPLSGVILPLASFFFLLLHDSSASPFRPLQFPLPSVSSLACLPSSSFQALSSSPSSPINAYSLPVVSPPCCSSSPFSSQCSPPLHQLLLKRVLRLPSLPLPLPHPLLHPLPIIR